MMLCPEEFFFLKCAYEQGKMQQDTVDKKLQECIDNKTEEFVTKGFSKTKCWVRQETKIVST